MMNEFVWKKQETIAEVGNMKEEMRKVLVIYTGGTIGMKLTTECGYQPASHFLEKKIVTYPHLCDPDYVVDLKKDWIGIDDFRPIALPVTYTHELTYKKYRILYTILEYDPLLDSSNMGMEDWAKIGKDIETYYRHFNAFVVLHGTDTMAYTASALSFMLEDLGKTVIVTGSQVPISEVRNDGRDNLLGALILAGEYVIPEVTIYFHNKLYRGNRCTKTNSSSYEAFSSPNLPPLATVGVDIQIEWEAIQRPCRLRKFKVHTEMNHNVGILRIFPGITAVTIKSFLQPPMQGVILQTYGAGNVPDTGRYSYIEELKAACDQGVIVVNCTQCNIGKVSSNYAGAIKLSEAGVLPGGDMTAEAALTKLSYLLGKGLPSQQIKELMTKNLCGEMTVLGAEQKQLRDSDLLTSIAQAMNLSSSSEVRQLRHTLFPPLMCAAAANGDSECLESLSQQGGDFNIPDYDGRTPLHLACSEGHLDTVKYLLQRGASVHATDRFNHTPLDDAVRFRKLAVIQVLVDSGAELNTSSCEIACVAASDSDSNAAVLAWHLAGRNSRRESINTPCPIKAFKESLDTAANLEEELMEKVRRLSASNTPPPSELVASGSVDSTIHTKSDGYWKRDSLSTSNGTSNCDVPVKSNDPLNCDNPKESSGHLNCDGPIKSNSLLCNGHTSSNSLSEPSPTIKITTDMVF